MARLTPENVVLAQEIIDRYPRPKSALIPLLHLAQEQDGYLTDDAMAHIGELVGVTSGRGPRHGVVLRDVQDGARRALPREHLHQHLLPAARRRGAARTTPSTRLGIQAGQTTADGLFTIEDVECIAACTEAPCLQVNYRYFHKITHTTSSTSWSTTSRRAPATTSRRTAPSPEIRQHIPPERKAGSVVPEDTAVPVWIAAAAAAEEADA